MFSQLQTAVAMALLCLRIPRIAKVNDAESAVNFAMSARFIRPAQVRGEFQRLAKIIEEMRPQRAMEIGTFKGGTLFALCRLADSSATIISLDLPGGPFGGGYRWFRSPIFRQFLKPGQSLHLIRADSHTQDAKRKVEAALAGQPLDFLLIDGDHAYEGAKRDFDMYSPLVRPGGLIAFHDIVKHPPSTGCEVSRLWCEIKGRYKYEEIIENHAQDWAGIGIITV